MKKEGRFSVWAAVGLACVLGAMGCQTTGDQSMEIQEPAAVEPEVAQARAERPERMTRIELKTVYFDRDRAELRPEARAILKAKAEQITANPHSGTFVIEGHCDERGSQEYNLALGERRANAVERYLRDLGVPAGRLKVVSYGESRPAMPGHDESAWRFNRRSVIRADAQHLSLR